MARTVDITENQFFSNPPKRVFLNKSEIDVWAFSASNDEEQLLNHNEKSLAKRFYHQEDRLRFITGRNALRILAASYLGLTPEEIDLEFGIDKKPIIRAPNNKIHFNISHSGKWVLIAFSEFDLGIDIELVKNDFSVLEMLPNYFNREEQDFVLNHDDTRFAFYILWTRKEALMKAWGTGLQDNLQEISSFDTAPWIIKSFKISEEYPVALAYKGNAKSINYFLGNSLLS